jgi:hypothetical protein
LSETPHEPEKDGDDSPSPEELAVWLSDFMNSAENAGNMYRQHFCKLIVERVYAEFGSEGFCELMMQMDKRAGWISDIIIENSDLDEILFKKYGVYDGKAIEKARASESLTDLNKKIWRLRKKHAKEIVEELMNGTTHIAQ